MMNKRFTLIAMILFCTGFLVTQVQAQSQIPLSDGQTVYAPVYSHIYSGNKKKPLLLAVTLSIRNTDPANSLVITTVNYHNSQGNLIRKYIEKPIKLKPMSSKRYIINESDKEGGSGANFIINWNSVKPITLPIIESVMISTKSQLGVSFTSRGQAIKNRNN